VAQAIPPAHAGRIACATHCDNHRMRCLPILLLFAACTLATDKPDDIGRDIQRAGALRDRWAADWNAKRLDDIMTLYAEDAVFLRPTAERTTGLTAIRSLFEKVLATNTPHIVLHPITTERSGNLAYDSGTYDETILSAGVSRATRGDYLIILKRQSNGEWVIAQQAWTDRG
jgi:uncharacterized protein (TIGR02246 family)